MKSYFLSIIALCITINLSSCANEYAYDEENPESYRKHWENNDEIKQNKLLYQLSEECDESNKHKNKELCY